MREDSDDSSFDYSQEDRELNDQAKKVQKMETIQEMIDEQSPMTKKIRRPLQGKKFSDMRLRIGILNPFNIKIQKKNTITNN